MRKRQSLTVLFFVLFLFIGWVEAAPPAPRSKLPYAQVGNTSLEENESSSKMKDERETRRQQLLEQLRELYKKNRFKN